MAAAAHLIDGLDALSAEEREEAIREVAAGHESLLRSLADVTRILEAFGYTQQLGATQKARLDQARAEIAKGKALQARVSA